MKDLSATAKYLLAVSGGSDSMAMLDMFVNYKVKLDFDVVTVNHGLRDTAERDCRLVSQYCNLKGVNCTVSNIDVKGYCQQHNVSTETGARILRHELLQSLSQNYDFICLAHNKDDNAETILMHILRGSGLKGAEGIRALDGKLLRPVLDYTKQQLTEYCVQHNVPFCEDETNSDTQYRRNFIRHKVMPLLREYNQGVVDNLVRFGDNVSCDNAVLDKLADISQVVFDENSAKIPVQLLTTDNTIAYRVIDKTLRQMGYFHDIERVHYLDLIKLAGSSGGKSVNLPFGLRAYNDYDFVAIIKEPTEKSGNKYSYPFGKGEFATDVGVVVVDDCPPCEGKAIGKVLRLDYNKIPQGSVIRTALKGDMFTKFGGGTKPLSRYLIDKKVSRRNRDILPVVAKDNIVEAVIGVEISDRVQTDSTTSVIYYLYITKEGQH